MDDPAGPSALDSDGPPERRRLVFHRRHGEGLPPALFAEFAFAVLTIESRLGGDANGPVLGAGVRAFGHSRRRVGALQGGGNSRALPGVVT